MNSPSSAGLLLLHVVVMSPPPQHVHSVMRTSVQSTHPVGMECENDVSRHAMVPSTPPIIHNEMF